MSTAVRPGDLVRPAHKKAARMVGMALTLHERVSYEALAKGLGETLQPAEAHGLAWAALKACAPAVAWDVARQRLDPEAGEGPPEPPDWFFGMHPAWIMDDAMCWARAAGEFERRAYAMACLAHMPEEERHAIVRALDGRAG